MTSTTPTTGPAAPDGATLEAVDRWVEYRVWHSRTPGAQVAVGWAGTVVFSRGYGLADLAGRVPMRPDHLFRIASHSKTFTATLVLQLVEQGRLGLEDPLGRHLTAVADGPLGAVAVRELLEHTGGVLRDGRDADHWQFARPFPDRDQLLALAREGGTKAGPGEQFAYSNIGYSLLGLLVEEVTGEPFATAAQRRILDPLGLRDTAADYWPDRAGDYAVGHSGLFAAAEREAWPHLDTSAMVAATGFTSTAEDLVRYFSAHALGDERLLSDRSKRLQQRMANRADPHQHDGEGYGLGMVVEEIDDRVYVGHSGGYPGHITKTLLDPRSGLVVSVLTNAVDGPATPLARGVLALLTADAEPGDGEGPPGETARRFTGRYAGSWSAMDLALVRGRLRALELASWSPMEQADVLAEDGPDRLRIVDGRGYGSVGEPVTLLGDDPAGGIRYGGLSMRRLDVLPPTR